MQKLRRKRREEGFDEVKERSNENARIWKIRKGQSEARKEDPDLMAKYREKETLRKRIQRAQKKEMSSSNDGGETNYNR